MTKYYYSVDEQGSTDLITDTDGNIKNEYWYDAFGNVLESREEVHNKITYTGQQFDNTTQQYYLRARFYNPVIGRFTQEDVYRGDGLNLYAYCENNPIIYFDPNGYSSSIDAIRNYRGIDISGIDPKYLADPNYIIEMPFVGKKFKNSNSQGWKRDSKYFFKNLQAKHPEIFSKKNTIRIKNGKTPEVDDKFIKYFPQYKDNKGEILRHHHIGGGGQAMPIPDTLHPGYGGIHNIEKEHGILSSTSYDSKIAERLEYIKNNTSRTKLWKKDVKSNTTRSQVTNKCSKK